MLRTRLTLRPGAKGTKKLVEQYGKRLVCVRYRYDADKCERLKTIELVEERSRWLPRAAFYLVKILFEEEELRERVKRAGGRWDKVRKLWRLSAGAVERLHLRNRVAAPVEPE